MKKVILERYKGDQNQSNGILIVEKDGLPIYSNVCMERGYRNNERNVSNVPAGVYPLVYEWSPKFQRYLWELKEVPGRSECKIHNAKYWYHLKGCISPGYYLKHLNSDGYYDVAYSENSLNMFHRVLTGIKETTIQIIDPIEGLQF